MKESTFQAVPREPDAHQPCLLISTASSWVSSALQALGVLSTTGWDGHSHVMSRWLHSSCLISLARSSVQQSLLSPILYCSSWRHLESWRLQCYFSPFCSLSTLLRHSRMMVSGACTPRTGLYSHPEQLFPSLAETNG